MAKKSRKRVPRYDKDQSGCMWSLMRIFDFRQGRSSQKLLSDRKRGSKRLAGASYPNLKLDALEDACDTCKIIDGGEKGETVTAVSGKLSVKELMEEEMFHEQDNKKDTTAAQGDAKPTVNGHGGDTKKNRRRSSKSSFDLDDADLNEDIVCEKPVHRKSKSLNSVNLNVMVEELCSQIHPKDNDEIPTQLNRDPFVIEEKLREATKVLVDHFGDGKSFTIDRKIQPPKELLDAVQILNTNKETFLKLLRDPDSQLVEHVQKLQDFQVDEDGNLNKLSGSKLIQQDSGSGKQQGYIWRKLKGLERNVSTKNDSAQDISRIVVLKPGSSVSTKWGTLPNSSSLKPPQTEESKVQIGRVSSTFSFTELKRKLRYALRKGGLNQHSPEHLNPANEDREVGRESFQMASPSREHFFIERIPKFSGGIKKGKIERAREGTMCQDHENALSSEQKVSTIYTEAKKHIAEIVGNSEMGVDHLGQQVSESLGKMLSYPAYNSPTVYSPRKTRDIELLPGDECQSGDENECQLMNEIGISLLDILKSEKGSRSGIHDENLNPGADIDPATCQNDGLSCSNNVDRTVHLDRDKSNSGGDAYTAISTDTAFHNGSNILDTSVRSCSVPLNKSEQLDKSPESCENQQASDLEPEMFEENDPLSSPLSSTLDCSSAQKVEALDVTAEVAGRPSPVSVLEPLFIEDDISPPSIKNLLVVEPIQPRQIKFEDDISAPSDVVSQARTCPEDEKTILEFVKAVVEISGLTWDELQRRSLFSDHIVDPSLLDEVGYLPVPEMLYYDQKLLFDLINEAFVEVFLSYFSCILSLSKPYFHPELKRNDVVNETWKRVFWYIQPLGPPTLDQILAKDFAKPCVWRDFQHETEKIGIDMEDAILEELMEDVIWSWGCRGGESDFLVLSSEVNGTEIDTEMGDMDYVVST